MREESMNRDAYRDAYNEAWSELHKIVSEVESLKLRRERVEKLVQVLNQRFGFEAQLSKEKFVRTTMLPGLSLRTRLVVVEARSKN
jgi:hypothetical protein